MAWVQLQITDILNSLTVAEQRAFSGANSVAGQGAIVINLTEMIRGRVSAWRENRGTLGPGQSVGTDGKIVPGTIPSELYGAAISIGRIKLLSQIPGTQLITEARKQDAADAYKLLDQAATGELRIVGIEDVAAGQDHADSCECGSDSFFFCNPANPGGVRWTWVD